MQVGARVATSYRALIRVERPPYGGRSNAGNASCSWGAQGPLQETRRRFGEKTLRSHKTPDQWKGTTSLRSVGMTELRVNEEIANI